MKRNITLLKIILPLQTAWFWIGIWLPFYLSITDYAGIGFITSTLFLLGFFIEIPTGVVADIFGKKRTLILSLFLTATGITLLSGATEYIHIYSSVLIMIFGSALRSGTDKALLFDSLKQLGREKEYQSNLSQVLVLKMLSTSLAGLIGVWLYSFWVGLPFLLTGIFAFTGFLLSFFLQEPAIDTQKYNLKESFKQNFAGVKELVKIKENRFILFIIMILGSSFYIFIELQDPAILVSQGISDSLLGIILSLIPLTTAFGTYMFGRTNLAKNGKYGFYLLLLLIILITYILTPIVGLILNVGFLIYRNLLYDTLQIVSSDMINQQISSKNRATTLSTYTMIESLPIVTLGYLIGLGSDNLGADVVAAIIGGITLVLVIVVWLVRSFNKLKLQ